MSDGPKSSPDWMRHCWNSNRSKSIHTRTVITKMRKYTITLQQNLKKCNLPAQTLMALLKKCKAQDPYYFTQGLDGFFRPDIQAIG